MNDICTAQTNNVNNGNPGELNGPCLEGDLCNGDLFCYENVCQADADHDGIPSHLDCDDNDENVVHETVRVCTSACDEGTQMCLADGTWTACTAETTCECTEPGGIREHECGNCGWGYQHCGSDYQWGMVDECLDQGACRPGEESEQECTDICQWEDLVACTGECLVTARQNTLDASGIPDFKEEVCIPAGPLHLRPPRR
ncbi:hypothetical protein KJ865_05535 [Myxococcota bacterium]|nr:hypothetical protein [Myxococcota bacterium]